MNRSTESRLRILLVEDSPADAELLQDMLGDELPRSTVTVARTLAEARPSLTEPCDVVITDLSLPDAHGLQALAAVRGALPDVPVLVLTGSADRELALSAMSAGADDYLVKGAHDARGVSTALLYAVQRRRFERESRRFERLASSLLDAMEAPTCSVDRDGTIIAVNRAWVDFGLANGGDPGVAGVGSSYFEACRDAGPHAETVLDGLRHVLSGHVDRFEVEYPCHGPDEQRWFSLRINPLTGGAGAVLAHVDVTGTKQVQQALAHQSLHDALTDLPNRTLLGDRLSQALASAARGGSRVGVAFLDLDHFKRVNDSLGHHAGDELLVAVAERLRERLRGGDTLARFAGDEFVVVWADVTAADEADVLAARLRSAFDEPFRLAGRDVVVTASVGIALGAAPDEADQLLLAADAAMYDAKSHGRGCTRMYSAELRSGVEGRLQVEAELRAALERDELVLHYQPVVDLRTGRVRGVEALVRWQHPEGLRMPDAFIPVAESSGLIVPLGTWVLEEACRQGAAWRQAGLDLEMAVNLSVRQIAHPDVVATVEGALSRHGLPPERLLLEVTESAVMDDTAAAQVALDRLSALGAGIAIDDFGTGYSSLLYLKRYQVRALKVDRSFVAGMGVNDDDDAIVASVVSLARAVGSASIAEGVETEAQRAQLAALGCEAAQGYLFSRPVPADALPAALEQVERRRRLQGARQPVEVTVDRRVLARIDELRRDGASPHTIAAALNREGAPHPQGIRWHRMAVQHVADGALRTSTRRRPASSVPAPRRTTAPVHGMDVWSDLDQEVQRVGGRFAQALDGTGTVLVVAEQEQRLRLEEDLTGRGLDLAALRADGRYLDWDSDDLLPLLHIDGYLSARLFRDVVAATVEEVAQRGRVYAYGDLGALLCARGEVTTALALEDLFDRLARRVPMSLVCGYPRTAVPDAEAAGRLRALHRLPA